MVGKFAGRAVKTAKKRKKRKEVKKEIMETKLF